MKWALEEINMANRSTITIDSKTAENILEEIEVMRKSLETLRRKIMTLLPSKYGSDAWWEKAEREADEDIKAGRYTTYTNVENLIKDLHAGR